METATLPPETGLELKMQARQGYGEDMKVFTRRAIVSPIPKAVYRDFQLFKTILGCSVGFWIMNTLILYQS